MTPCGGCGKDNPPGSSFCVYCGAELPPGSGNVDTARMPAEGKTRSPTGAVLLDAVRQATLGEYEIMSELGRGGMAIVYLAHDIALDRKVAIKVISPNLLALGEGIPERFKREARTAASLSHPHIIPIYAVKEDHDLLFFVMKYVKGRPLESVIAEVGPLPIPMVQTILMQVGGALGYAHRHGVVHRDIKPGNVMLDEEGWAVVTDFGIAKVVQADALTQTGGTVGTPSYMSPEQCSGLPVTGASDQYSLGVVAYEMLTGRKPFRGRSGMAIMYKHCHEVPPPLSGQVADCPPGLADAVMRMLEKTPEDRWPSLEDMVSTIGAFSQPDIDVVRTQMLTLARTSTQAIVEKFTTPSSPVPRDRLSMSPAPASSVRRAPPPVPSRPHGPVALQPGGARSLARKLLWVVPLLLAATVPLLVWAPWKVRDGSSRSATQEDSVPASPPAAIPLASIEIAPTTWSLGVGDTLRMAARPVDAQGNTALGVRVDWESSDSAVLSVFDGLVKALTPGVAQVTASSRGKSATARITVAAAAPSPPPQRAAPPAPVRLPVASVTLEPAAATMGIGETLRLDAILRDRSGSELGSRPVTWRSDTERVATVSVRGIVTAVGEGTARITAVSEGRSSTATITVTPVPVASLTASPERQSLTVGDVVQLAVTARDARGNALDGRTIAWTSSALQVVNVSPEGVVRALAPGVAAVTAQSGTARATVQITVEATPPAPVAADDQTPQVRVVLVAYAQAIGNRDLAALKRLFPGIPARQEDGFRTFFDRVRDLTVRLTVLRVEIGATGDVARADVRLRYEFRDGGHQNEDNAFSVDLARSTRGWYITNVTDLR